MRDYTAQRIKRLRHSLRKENIPALLVTNLINIRYLSGFTGTSATMIVTNKRSFFITDFRYTEQANKQVTASKILEYKSSDDAIKELCKKEGIKKLGIEAITLPFGRFKNLKKKLSTISLLPISGIIEKLRSIKDQFEIDLLRQAISISGKGLSQTLPFLKEGVRERDIALELEYRLKRLGAEKAAFDFIVASGYRSSLPHGIAGNKKIKKGDIITIDFGCVYQGYNSDITRTFCLGKSSCSRLELYNLVLKAQNEALKKAKKGMMCKEIDNIARTVFQEKGMAKYFGHGLGHGVGLDIHEEPAVSMGVKQRIEEGMVITIEPGLYIPKKFGVRIEDMILVKGKGIEVLTKQIPKIFEI